jgi:hypothetical protein
MFSGHPCPSHPLFQVNSTMRSVAVLQICEEDGSILQNAQACFHGRAESQPNPQSGLSNYARAIAVLPGVDALDTRVVICGETFDSHLPEAKTPPNAGHLAGSSTGFIAVYDGRANLLWSYQFYGHATDAQTTVTDVAIHRDPTTGLDVVTYCGASSNGAALPTGTSTVSTMAPLHAFLAPPIPPACGSTSSYTGGASHNSTSPFGNTDQWDGFVGRLVAPHVNPQPMNVQRVFHSIVGGGHQEALFGITELSHDRFAVVGTLDTYTATFPNSWCPLTRPHYAGTSACPPSPPGTGGSALIGSVGVLLIFDASTIPLDGSPPSGPLALEFSTVIGHSSSETTANDVLWHGDRLWIVGATTDPAFVITPEPAYAVTRPGVVSGYVLVTDSTGRLLHASYTGAPQSGGSACVGVAAWHEYPDHVSICGWTTGIDNTVATPKRTEVLGFFLDSPTDQDLLNNKGLALVRRSLLAPNSVGESLPGASEFTFVQALRNQVPTYSRRSVNPPVGPTIELPTVAGGIAVDGRGLIHVVGSCKDQMDYPVTATGRGQCH